MGATEATETYVRDRIAAMAKGDQMPSERAIAAELGTSRTTVRLVLGNAVAARLLRAEHGVGYFRTGRRVKTG